MFESFLGKFKARLRNNCLCIFGLENWNYFSFGAFFIEKLFSCRRGSCICNQRIDLLDLRFCYSFEIEGH